MTKVTKINWFGMLGQYVDLLDVTVQPIMAMASVQGWARFRESGKPCLQRICVESFRVRKDGKLLELKGVSVWDYRGLQAEDFTHHFQNGRFRVVGRDDPPTPPPSHNVID